MIAKDIMAIKHSLSVNNIEYIMVKLIPNKQGKKSTFRLNIYSTPKNAKDGFWNNIRESIRKHGKNQLVVLEALTPTYGMRLRFRLLLWPSILQVTENGGHKHHEPHDGGEQHW